MEEKGYFIKANIFGKTKYWEFINGFHFGRKKTDGYSIYPTKRKANDVVRRLKGLYHSGITYQVLPESEMPFLKRQIKNKI